jgi:hypothetical protein
MDNTQKIRILNDLVAANHHRIAGYHRACRELQIFDINYRIVFDEQIKLSRSFINELSVELQLCGASAQEQASNQAAEDPFSGLNLDGILGQCEQVEQYSQLIYDQASQIIKDQPGDIAEKIIRQQSDLGSAHQRITLLRGKHKA